MITALDRISFLLYMVIGFGSWVILRVEYEWYNAIGAAVLWPVYWVLNLLGVL